MVQRRRALIQAFLRRFFAGRPGALGDRGPAAGRHPRPAVEHRLRLLAAKLSYGAFSMSLGDLVAFALTLWLASQVSRFLRFVLEEDVYPAPASSRACPTRCRPWRTTPSLSIGFFIGLAALGLDFTRFSLLAGAFGVGIGFGLQNIVNNFVSGLILLFERPVQVGDTVAVGDLTGDVKSIGIRSSTIRTWEGADVIVPNASLISDPVTNWTHTDRMRRIDIAGRRRLRHRSRRVLELLRGVAKEHQAVVPEPRAHCPVRRLRRQLTGLSAARLDRPLRKLDADPQRPHRRIHAALRDAGITIPFPQRDVHFFPSAQEAAHDDEPDS